MIATICVATLVVATASSTAPHCSVPCSGAEDPLRRVDRMVDLVKKKLQAKRLRLSSAYMQGDELGFINA